MRRESIFRQIDWTIIAMWLTMVVCGWFTIYAACFDYENAEVFNLSQRHGQQLIWIGLSFLMAVFMLLLDTKFYGNISTLFYFAMILLLIVTIFEARDVKGSRSWIEIGSFRFQPAELAKYATALFVAKYMSSYGYNVKNTRNFLKTAAIILAPMAIIIAQKETGSALVFAIFILVLFREGLNGGYLVYGALTALFFVLVIRYNNLPPPPDAIIDEQYGYVIVFAMAVMAGLIQIWYYTRDTLFMKIYAALNVVIWLSGIILKSAFPALLSYTLVASVSFGVSAAMFLIFAIVRRSKRHILILLFFLGTLALCMAADYAFDKVLQPHQQIRIKVVLGLEDDPQGAGYNVRQAKIAIGSGGIYGKGFLNGTQTKLNYVPEQHTDFIFCTIGEEKGFVGTTLVIVLYVVFIIRLIRMAERQRSQFSRIYGYSVASIFFFHFTINIGMVLGLLPVIGIPLPFFSYGGSSMIAFTIMLFTFIKLDTRRSDTMAV